MTTETAASNSHNESTDPWRPRYQKERMAHWDRVSAKKANENRPGAYYHKLLRYYYRFFITPGMRILEVGCGHGDLLAALEPAFGVGIDFSEEMVRCAVNKHKSLSFIQADAHDLPLKGKFDVIILSDLVNDLWDVQGVLEELCDFSHPGTRLILNFFNKFLMHNATANSHTTAYGQAKKRAEDSYRTWHTCHQKRSRKAGASSILQTI